MAEHKNVAGEENLYQPDQCDDKTTVNDETMSSESDSTGRAARIQFVESWIQPELEDVEKEIKQLELILGIMNTKMTLLVGHRKVFQGLKEIVMNRGVDFQDQDSDRESCIILEKIKKQESGVDKKLSKVESIAADINKIALQLSDSNKWRDFLGVKLNHAKELKEGKVEDGDDLIM